MYTFKPNQQNAKFAVLFTWILLGVEALSLVSSVMQFHLLRAMRYETFPDATLAANDMRETAIGVLFFVVYVIWLIAFLRWFYRARANLQTRLSYPLSCTPGWAVGNFFIPIVGLYRPYQTMKELYVDTRELFVNEGLSERTDLKTNYLGVWWALWLITNFLGNVILRVFRDVETIDELISMTCTNMVSEVVGIAFCFAIIIVIRDYSRAEPLLAEMPDAADAADGSDEQTPVAPVD